MLKRLIVCLGLISSICLNAVCVQANTITDSELNENIELDMYEKWIDEMDLPEEDKEFLIQDNHFREVYEKYEEEGIEINDIDVEDVSEVNSMARGTSYTSTGKVVSYSHVQPTKSKTYYNNKLYSSYKEVKNYVSIANAFNPFKWSWVASLLFSVPTDQYAVFFNTGYQKTEQNSTVYTKDAYYKVGSRYYIGYAAQRSIESISILSYYRDKNNAPHQSTKTSTKTFNSANYNSSNATLVSLAKKYYDTGWILESIPYSSVKIN